MERKSLISAKVWNSLSEEDIRSLVFYLRLLGHPVEERHLPVGKIPIGTRVVFDCYGDLYNSYLIWPGYTKVKLKDIRKMVALGNFT